jgi:hypothetical protein
MIADEYAWLRQLLHRLDRALGKWGAVEEEIDTIRCDLQAVLRQSDPATPSGRRPVGHDLWATLRQREQQEKARVQYAATGAKALDVNSLPGGAYEFIIDGQYRLKLSPRLAALLQVLIQPEGASPDALVSWKSRTKVRRTLAPKSGLPITEHALNGLVSRLRKELQFQINFHRNFVMVHPAHGLRFAVQKKARGDGSACDPL